MSNSKDRKNLIDQVGVTAPLSVLSCREITERNAARVRRASVRVVHLAEVDALIKASIRDNQPQAEEPEVISPIAESSNPVIAEQVVEEVKVEEAPAPVSEVPQAPAEESKASEAEPAPAPAESAPAAPLTITASMRRPAFWYQGALAAWDAICAQMRASDIEAGYWYRKAQEMNSKHGRAYKSLAQEHSEMPEWEKQKLSRTTFDQQLVDDDVILSVRHLKKFFTLGSGLSKDKLKAVHDVSFDVHKGEVFGLVGESGCGKTTTGRTLIRLHAPTSGSVYFMGYRIAAGDRWNQKEIKWKRKRGRAMIKKLKSDRRAELNEAKQDPSKRSSIPEIKALYSKHIAESKAQIRETIAEQKAKIRQIHYDENHVDKHLLTKMQMIFQDPIDSLDPRMTVQDIIAEGLKIQHYGRRMTERLERECSEHIARLKASNLPASIKADKEAFIREDYRRRIAKVQDYKGLVADVLAKVGLIPEYASRYPHEFSGGQRQRIGIARALVMNPELIVADEPISALDVSIRAQIINLLNDLRDEMGLTIVFIAHDLSVVKYFCERIAVMYFGNLVELATSDELFKHPLHPYTKSLLSAIPKPDPLSEKTRVRIKYNPAEDHDYSRQEPTLQEIEPGHFVLANDAEMEKYRKEIEEDDRLETEKQLSE